MCSSQDSKYFLPPTPMGSTDFSVPQAYQSNKEPTTDVGNTTPVPAPDQGYGSYPGGGGLLPPSNGKLGPWQGPRSFGGGGPVGRFGGGSPFYGGMPFRGYPGLPTSPRFGGGIGGNGMVFGGAASGFPGLPTNSSGFGGVASSMPSRFNGFSTGTFNRRMILG